MHDVERCAPRISKQLPARSRLPSLVLSNTSTCITALLLLYMNADILLVVFRSPFWILVSSPSPVQLCSKYRVRRCVLRFIVSTPPCYYCCPVVCHSFIISWIANWVRRINHSCVHACKDMTRILSCQQGRLEVDCKCRLHGTLHGDSARICRSY